MEILQSDNSHANTKTFGEDTAAGDEKCYEIKAVGSKLYAGCLTNSAGWSQDATADVMFWKFDQSAFTIDSTMVIGLLAQEDDYGAMDISSDETLLYFSSVYAPAGADCQVTIGKIDMANEAISW